MAYTPTVWAKGDVITAVKLNKAEQGIAANSQKGGVLIVADAIESGVHTLGSTWKEIKDAQDAGNIAVIYFKWAGAEDSTLAGIVLGPAGHDETNGYYVSEGGGVTIYTTDSENGYPAYDENNS